MQSIYSIFSTKFLSAIVALVIIVAIATPTHANDISIYQEVDTNYPSLSLKSTKNQTDIRNDTGKKHRGGIIILNQFYDDVTYLIKEPDFYGVIGGLGVAPSAFSSAFRNEDPEFTEMWGHSRFADKFFESGEVIGNGALPVMASMATWGIGKISGSSRLSKFGSDLFRAEAVNGCLTLALKVAINRKRPNGGPYSYPSGHTSTAFAAAGTIYADYGKTLGIPAFILAGYVGLSRLQEGKHYTSDVIAGGILGTYVSLKLTRRRKTGGKMSISPLINSDGTGISFDLRI